MTGVRDASQLELATQADLITGLKKAWTQMTMHFDGSPDDPFAEQIGRMIDESHMAP